MVPRRSLVQGQGAYLQTAEHPEHCLTGKLFTYAGTTRLWQAQRPYADFTHY
jgi:hypothetical protein